MNDAYVFSNESPSFYEEYAVSGWFKWSALESQSIWHTAFRFTINNEHINENTRLLGDRALALFVGNEMTNNIYAFTTYSYTDSNGNGNPNYWEAVPYESDLESWHFVYFGYSRHLRRAYAYVRFNGRAGEVNFVDANHFISPNYYVYVGQDQFYPAYNGQIRQFALNAGDGAFSLGPYDGNFGFEPVVLDPPVQGVDDGSVPAGESGSSVD